MTYAFPNIRVTDLAAQRSVGLNMNEERHQRWLERFILEINGGGMNAKSTANAMLDARSVREGQLPFTRNGYRFEVE